MVFGVGALSTAARFNSPLPLSGVLAGHGVRVAREERLDLVRREAGRWLSSSAAAPETTAAACDVPLPRKKRLSTFAMAPNVSSMNDPGSRSDTMCVPGAERSGLRVPSPSLVKDAGWW